MPIPDLAGLWLFDEGENGSGIENVTDHSGNCMTTIKKTGYSAPKKRSCGLEVATSNGVIIETDLAANVGPRTIIAAVTHTLPGDEASIFNCLFTSDENGFDGNPANVNPAASHPTLVCNGGNPSGGVRYYAPDNSIMGAQSLNPAGTANYGEVMIAAVTIDMANGTIRLANLGSGASRSVNAGVDTYFDGVTEHGSFQFGIWPFQGGRSAVQLIGRLYGVAVYDRVMSVAKADAHMQGMEAILAAI